MVGLFVAGLLLAFVGLTQAIPDPEIRLLEDLIQGAGVQQGMSKRDLEFNQYVPAYRLRGEPSCEELRAMWRLSKREARRATSTNNIPRSRPYSYSRLLSFAPNPNSRPFIYGEPRNFASHNSVSFSPVRGSFDRLRVMLGVGAGRPGSFQKVRGMVATQRLPGENSKGKLDELRGMVLDGHPSRDSEDEEEEEEEVMAVSPSLRSSEIYQPVRRTPPLIRFNEQQRHSQAPKEGFIGSLMPADTPTSALTSDWRARPWNPREK